MNTKTKRRMIAATGVIIIVAVLVLAIVGGNAAARTVSVAEARTMGMDTSKIQVTGNVANNSFEITGDTLTFDIYDPQADPTGTATLAVRYEGGVSATFGNEVTAICTGRMDPSGYLTCTELVTKCPSKYESAEGSLTIDDLLAYGDSVIDKPVKVHGIIKPGTIVLDERGENIVDNSYFTIAGNPETDDSSTGELAVAYPAVLADDIEEGSAVVLTGALMADGTFEATVVATEA